MTVLLDELLHVKRLREDEAIKVMKEKQLQLEQCQKILDTKIADHDDYVVWRKKEEKRLYQEVLDKEVHAYNLNIMRDQIKFFREKQQQLKEEIEKARTAVTDATEHLEEARQARMEAYKTVKKYEEYRDIMQTIENRETEKREELEAEEFNIRPAH